VGGKYEKAGSGTTVGNRRILQFPLTNAEKLRIQFEAKAPIVISTIEIYRVPELLTNE
jgi:hypothetical protein